MIRRIGLFILINFSLSWLLAGIYWWLGGTLSGTGFMFVSLLYMSMPALTAIVLHLRILREPVVEPLGIVFEANRWFGVAWLLPAMLAMLALIVGLGMPGVTFAPGLEGMYEKYGSALTPEQLAQMKAQAASLPMHPYFMALIAGLLAGVTINALFAFGEELGWRGFLYRELSPLGFWPSALITGLLWGVWHAPLILQGYNYPEHPLIGVGMMIVWCMLLSPIFAFVRERSRSVLAPAILHGSLNGTYGLSVMLLRGGSDLTTGLLGLPGFAVLMAVNIAIALWRWVESRTASPQPPTAGPHASEAS